MYVNGKSDRLTGIRSHQFLAVMVKGQPGFTLIVDHVKNA